MFRKVLAVICVASCSIALEQSYQHPTSFVSFNDNHNTVQHIQSSHNQGKPSLLQYSTPSHSSPVQAAPAPVQTSQVHFAGQYSSSLGTATERSIQFPSSSSLPTEARIGASIQGIPVSHGVSVPHQYSVPTVSNAPHFLASQQKGEYEPAQYKFAYGVEDHQTGDIHSHKESREGDKTQGEYSLHEADGTIRIVRYTVDGHSGFNAVIDNSGHNQQHH